MNVGRTRSAGKQALINTTIRGIIPVAALAAAAGLAVAGCSQPTATASTTTTTTTALTASAQAGPAVPVLDWKPCDNGFQCATARVPLNYADPHGAQISIAVISHRATGSSPALGWLFVNGGGPNPQVSTMSRVYPNLPAAWRERYNLIMFDPRGEGYSTQIQCSATSTPSPGVQATPRCPPSAGRARRSR